MSDDPTAAFLARRMAMFMARTELGSDAVRVRELSPIERQRRQDGTPITSGAPSSIKPEGAKLYLAKGSLMEKVPDMRFQPTKQDPPAFDMSPNEIVKSYLAKGSDPALRKEHKDPKGGLTAEGRKFVNEKTGSNLKPGVKGKADTPEEMRRKSSFLLRHYKGEHNASKPLKDDNGNPTRHALQAAAWGEPVPKNRSDVAKLVREGERLRALYEKSKADKA